MDGFRRFVQSGLPLFVELRGYYVLPALGMALVALRYLATTGWLARRLAPRSVRGTRVVLLGILAATAVLSVVVYHNFFNFHYGGYVNAYEFYHYYLGSKYWREIGYFDLYNASLVADAETGGFYRPADGAVMDLRTYRYAHVDEVLREAERYRSRFSPQRWQEWLRDVASFRARMGLDHWNRVLHDKGYNATPVWTMVVERLFSRPIAADSDRGLLFVAVLDALLLGGALACAGWVFGAWPALLAGVFLASSYLVAHVHLKGAFLKSDFVVCLILALCALKKDRPATAGALVGYAALSRLFPALFVFGPAVKLVWEVLPVGRTAVARLRERLAGGRGTIALALTLAVHAVGGVILVGGLWAGVGQGIRGILGWRNGAVAWGLVAAWAAVTLGLLVASCAVWGVRAGLVHPRHPRFFAGFLLAVGLLGLASVVHAGGVGPWSEFAQKMAVHRKAPHMWNVGWASLLAAEFDPAKLSPTEAHLLAQAPPSVRNARPLFRPSVLAERAALRWSIVSAVALLGLVAFRGLRDHQALAFGFVPTFFVVSPAYYYYIVLLLPLLTLAEELERPAGAVGLQYLFLWGALGHAFYQRWEQYYPTYYWNSVLALGLAVYLVALATRWTWRVVGSAEADSGG